jgi:Tetracyclin repressor-like, C-terminal domain
LFRAFGGPLRQALPGLVADMAHDVELAETFRREVLDARRKSMRAAFARGGARGEVRGNLELELLLDMLTGAVLLPRAVRACADQPPHGV